MSVIQIEIDNFGNIAPQSLEEVQRLFRIYKGMAERNREMRAKMKECPLCNQSVRDYRISLTKMSIAKLAHISRVFKGVETDEVSFSPRDVRASDDTNFAKLVHFGLLYRQRDRDGRKIHRGIYGMNRRYVGEFFDGRRSVPAFIWKNPVTGEKTHSEERITIDGIHSIQELIGTFGDIATEFREQEMPDIPTGAQISFFPGT